ncbi:MAG: prolyl oligopeptidase family serine peptidase [Candidatus Sumerlaeota bacterium]|nr:prolyl oligopeptidase family serine peptidase [Candidatus Sumerlaeota bacterium]
MNYLWLIGNGMIFAVASVCAAQGQGWQADPKLLEDLTKKNTKWNYSEEKVGKYTLPDPLVCQDGTRISNKEEWERKGRPETLELFSKYVYGHTPAKPAEVKFDILATDDKALDGRATLKRIRITAADGGKSFSFETALLVPNDAAKPNDAPKPAPAFILINNRPITSADPSRKVKDAFWPAEEIIARGYATAVFMTNDVDADKADEALRAKGVRGVWPGAADDGWATIGAWAWGASRVMDYLVTDPQIDSKKVAVIGHSRGGKTALWAGAQDQRFAIAISNDSGCGGAALSRRNYGETVATINKAFPYWFCRNFKKFDNKESELPIDQHQLVALMAPRGVCVGSADADFWADQRGEFLAVVHAAPVYALYGFKGLKADEMPTLETPIIRDRVDYHIRKGGHGLTLTDWTCYMDFADKLFGKK